MMSRSRSKGNSKEETLLTEPLPLPEVSLPEWQFPPPQPQQCSEASNIALAVQSLQNVQRALGRFQREAPQEELKRFRLLWRRMEKKGLRQTHKGQFTNEWKWLVSLIVWDAYQSGNQEQALEALHEWLDVDCAFFLRQWWVSELVASWHKNGEARKIRRLFEGRRGRPPRQSDLAMFLRDQQIVAAVEKHLLVCGYNEALRQTYTELKSLKGAKRLSVSGIRRAYEQAPALDPLRDATIYYAIKTVCVRYGLSEEDAAHEVASHPERYRLCVPLSPALIQQVCKRYTQHHPRRL